MIPWHNEIQNSSDSPKCLTLFAGCGGADIGIASAGFSHHACIEGDETAYQTLMAAGFPGVHAWIGGQGPDGQPAWNWDGTPVYLLWASPPCQPYSLAGEKAGAADARDGWPATLAAIAQIRPVWCIIENVVGCPAADWAKALTKLGYVVSHKTLQAADWGLPSSRQRVFVVAGPCAYPWPTPTHYGPKVPFFVRAGKQPWKGIRDALGVTGAVRATHSELPTHARPERVLDGPALCISANHGGRAGQTYVLVPGNGGNFNGEWRNMEEIAHTVTASCPQYFELSPAICSADGQGVGGAWGRDALEQAIGRRRLTWQESAILVDFPENYPFQGGITAKYKQVGNAVAPLMACALARPLLALRG
jgi:DNA (cytosine-5)-methyltransferase 1